MAFIFVVMVVLGGIMVFITLRELKEQGFVFCLETVDNWIICISCIFMIMVVLCRFPVRTETYTIDHGFDILGTDSISYNGKVVQDIEINTYFDETENNPYSLTVTKEYNIIGIHVGTDYKLNVYYTRTKEK